MESKLPDLAALRVHMFQDSLLYASRSHDIVLCILHFQEYLWPCNQPGVTFIPHVVFSHWLSKKKKKYILNNKQFSLVGYFSDSKDLALKLIFFCFYTNFLIFLFWGTQVHRFKFKSSHCIFTKLHRMINNYLFNSPLKYVIIMPSNFKLY